MIKIINLSVYQSLRECLNNKVQWLEYFYAIRPGVATVVFTVKKVPFYKIVCGKSRYILYDIKTGKLLSDDYSMIITIAKLDYIVRSEQKT